MGSLHGLWSNYSKNIEEWFPPIGKLKCNVDGATTGKPGAVGTGGIQHNFRGQALFMFCISVGSKNSNAAKILAILKALRIYSRDFQDLSIVQSDSSNEIPSVAAEGCRHC